MNIEKNKGSAIAQYAIIITLVAIVVIPGLFIMSGSINDIYENFVAFLTDNNKKTQEFIDESNAAPTDFSKNAVPEELKSGGTPDKPVINCANNECVMDYGTFILSGVPENYEDYFKTTGTSGTTDTILDLLDQITTQINPADTSMDINLLKQLAKYGHAIAKDEKKLEDFAKEYLADPTQLVSNQFLQTGTFLTQSSERAWFDITLGQINDSLKSPTTETDKNIKALVNLLATEITDLAGKMSEVSLDCGSGYNIPLEKVQKVIEPDASNITNLDSAIICATGHGSDTGKVCK